MERKVPWVQRKVPPGALCISVKLILTKAVRVSLEVQASRRRLDSTSSCALKCQPRRCLQTSPQAECFGSWSGGSSAVLLSVFSGTVWSGQRSGLHLGAWVLGCATSCRPCDPHTSPKVMNRVGDSLWGTSEYISQ